jgi:hypothetical protein
MRKKDREYSTDISVKQKKKEEKDKIECKITNIPQTFRRDKDKGIIMGDHIQLK